VSLAARHLEANGIPTGITSSDQTTAQVLDPATVDKYAPQLVITNGGPSPWSQVDWKALNAVESALGGYFSHMLPLHGLQQYYELIGKYPQFREGWYDENSSFDAYYQLRTDTPNSFYYMQQRGDANNMYSIASTALAVVLVNHFASAIEAALWAHGHEKIIETKVNLNPLPDNLGYETQFQLAVNF